MKKSLSILLALIMVFTVLPPGVFAVSASADIAHSKFFSVEDSYYKYVESPKAAIQADYSGAVTAISDAIAAVAASVDISTYGILTSQIDGIFTNEISQNPAFFFLKGATYSYYSSTGIIATVNFTYYYTSSVIQQMKVTYEASITKALTCIKPEMSDAEKTLAIHDYLILNAKYDYANFLNNTLPYISHTAYGVLALNVGVCDGYALAFKELMTRLGIPTIKVMSVTMNHTWNLVRLGSKWYHVDVSSDDPIFLTAQGWVNNDFDLEGSVHHKFFLLSDSAISALDYSGWAPSTNVANSKIYDGKFLNIKSGMFWNQGYWHYNSGGNLTRSLFNLSASSVLKTVNGSDNNYSYLGVFNNEIYYNITASDNSISEIRKCKFDGSSDTQVLLIDNTGKTVKERITELVIQDGIIKYTVYRSPASGSAQYAERYHTIVVTPPVAPTLSQTPTTPTNGNVTVTIFYPADAAVKEYKVGTAGAWTTYTGAVVLTANNTVKARCKDEFGNWSNIGSITVENIWKLVVREGSTTVIDPQTNFVYGLKDNLTKADFENGFIRISGDVKLEYEFFAGVFGTGTKVKLVDNTTRSVLLTYTILIFGDVNGDGNIDAIDAGVLVDYENSTNSWDALADAAQYKASDVNGDGNIDSIDAGILVDIENNLKTINQATGLAA